MISAPGEDAGEALVEKRQELGRKVSDLEQRCFTPILYINVSMQHAAEDLVNDASGIVP